MRRSSQATCSSARLRALSPSSETTAAARAWWSATISAMSIESPATSPFGFSARVAGSPWPDPERFDPERFTPERVGSRPKLAYLPFGAGPRICIGNHFARMEALIILASVVQRHALEVKHPGAVGLDPKVTLRPAGGIPARLVRREARRAA